MFSSITNQVLYCSSSLIVHFPCCMYCVCCKLCIFDAYSLYDIATSRRTPSLTRSAPSPLQIVVEPPPQIDTGDWAQEWPRAASELALMGTAGRPRRTVYAASGTVGRLGRMVVQLRDPASSSPSTSPGRAPVAWPLHRPLKCFSQIWLNTVDSTGLGDAAPAQAGWPCLQGDLFFSFSISNHCGLVYFSVIT
jgi:hypothetical protein